VSWCRIIKPPVFRAPTVQKQEIEVTDNGEVEQEMSNLTGEKISRLFLIDTLTRLRTSR
jgi:hypothetical protein